MSKKNKTPNTTPWVILLIIVIALALVNYTDPEDYTELISVDNLEGDNNESETVELVEHTSSIISEDLKVRLGYFNIELHHSVYNHFVFDAPQNFWYYPDEISKEAEAEIWLMYLEDDNDLYVIDQLIENAKERTGNEGDNLVRDLIYLVRRIPYDETINYIVYSVRYPYETLYDNTGMCADKSLLLGKILKRMGYGVALFLFDEKEHMTVGIQCNKGNFETDYCFVESTGPGTIGSVNLFDRYDYPEVVPIYTGKVMNVEASSYLAKPSEPTEEQIQECSDFCRGSNYTIEDGITGLRFLCNCYDAQGGIFKQLPILFNSGQLKVFSPEQ